AMKRTSTRYSATWALGGSEIYLSSFLEAAEGAAVSLAKTCLALADVARGETLFTTWSSRLRTCFAAERKRSTCRGWAGAESAAAVARRRAQNCASVLCAMARDRPGASTARIGFPPL